MERPAHQPARATPGSATTYGYQFPQLFAGGFIDDGIPDGRACTGFAEPDRPVVRAALADDRHHVPGHADVHARPALDPHRASRSRATARIRTAAQRISATSASTPRGNPNSTSNALADALLGNFRTYNEASADPVGFFRFTAYQAFVSDTWRVRPNLSLEARRALRVRAADLHAGQQPGQLRSGRSTTRRRR